MTRIAAEPVPLRRRSSYFGVAVLLPIALIGCGREDDFADTLLKAGAFRASDIADGPWNEICFVGKNGALGLERQLAQCEPVGDGQIIAALSGDRCKIVPVGPAVMLQHEYDQVCIDPALRSVIPVRTNEYGTTYLNIEAEMPKAGSEIKG